MKKILTYVIMLTLCMQGLALPAAASEAETAGKAAEMTALVGESMSASADEEISDDILEDVEDLSNPADFEAVSDPAASADSIMLSDPAASTDSSKMSDSTATGDSSTASDPDSSNDSAATSAPSAPADSDDTADPSVPADSDVSSVPTDSDTTSDPTTPEDPSASDDQNTTDSASDPENETTDSALPEDVLISEEIDGADLIEEIDPDLVTGGVYGAAMAEDAVVPDGDYYIFASIGTRMVLDISGASKEKKGNLQIYQTNETNAQVFRIKNLGDGKYSIQNLNSGLYLDCAGGSAANNTNVWQWTWNGSIAQQWYITKSTVDGAVTIQAANGKCVLDIDNARTANGTNVRIHNANGTAAQRFRLVKAYENLTDIESGYYRIVSGLSSSRRLEVENATWISGGNVALGPDAEEAASVFYISNLGSGYYSIEACISGHMLTWSGSQISGANVFQSADTGSASQRWMLRTSTKDGYVSIRSASSLMAALDITSGLSAKHTNIRLWRYNGTDAELWRLVKTDAPEVNVPEGTYVLRSRLNETRALRANGNSATANVDIAAYNGTESMRFFLKKSADGTYEIENVANGNVLDVANNAKTAGTNVWQYFANGSTAQKWNISGCRGRFTIQSVSSGLVLDVAGGKDADGSNVQIWRSNGSKAQQWRLEFISSDTEKTAGRGSVNVYDPATRKTFKCEDTYNSDPRVGYYVKYNGQVLSEEDFLTAVLYTEAGDQGHDGMMMVGYVIRNRLESGIAAANAGNYVEYPGTLDIMIYHYNQWQIARRPSTTQQAPLTRVLYDIVRGYGGDGGSDDYLKDARAAAKAVLADENITLTSSAIQFTPDALHAGRSLRASLQAGAVLKRSTFVYNSFMTPAAWARYANDGRHTKFSLTYDNGKHILLYRGHVFFMDEELW